MKKANIKMVQIVGIHKKDACYKNKERHIGLKGEFNVEYGQYNLPYVCGTFYNDAYLGGSTFFFAVRYKKL